MSESPTLGRLRQEDLKFKANLTYRARLKKPNQTKTKKS
jgi:hypothetical protein